jgi:phosphoglycolate phosphatase-like HAD superfamily hydrolase
MANTRGGLVKLAIREARRAHGLERHANIALIGDAPADVIAAHSNGIRSIAVQTGITPVEELQALTPDFLLRDLRHFRLHMIEDGDRAHVL